MWNCENVQHDSNAIQGSWQTNDAQTSKLIIALDTVTDTKHRTNSQTLNIERGFFSLNKIDIHLTAFGQIIKQNEIFARLMNVSPCSVTESMMMTRM